MFDTTESNVIEIYITPKYKVFYSDNTNYGIFSACINEDTPNKDFFNSYYKKQIDELGKIPDITVVGSMPLLELNSTYVANVIQKEHPKYGVQYEVKSCYKKPFSTREEQVAFLKTVLTSFQADTIIEAYPEGNLIDMIKNDEIDVDKLYGIGESRIKEIKNKIEENEKYFKAVVELSDKFGLNFNTVKKLSEEYGSPDLLLQKIEENPYILTEVDGYGFKKVDEIALKMNIDRKSEHRINACINYVLNDYANNKGHVWVKRSVLISEVVKLTGLKISDIQIVIEKLNSNKKVMKKYILDNKDRMFLSKYYYEELAISGHIKRLLSVDTKYNIPDIDKAIEEVENEQGFKFTDEQRRAIELSVNESVVVVSGKAGSGKTSVIKGIIKVLNKVDKQYGFEYTTCALAGKASQRIQEATGLKSATIHRTLGFNPNFGWQFDEQNKLGYDLVVLDEASMVNSSLFLKLIRAIKDGGKLIITGDDGQLSPIGVGNVFYDLLRSDIVPKVELTKVHRQAQQSGILYYANQVRDGIDFTKELKPKFQRLGELKDLYFYPNDNQDDVYEKIIEISSKYNGDILEYQVIVPMKERGNVSVLKLNNELQKIFNKDPEDIDDLRKINRGKFYILEGDKVIMKKNDYEKDVFNGTIGIVEYIDNNGGKDKKGEIVIDFEGVGKIKFTKEEMKNIELAYALTAHSTQGSQWDFVVFALTNSDYILLDKQLLYTGMTRAKKGLMLIVEAKAVKHAIKTDNSSKRNTILKEFLETPIK